MTRQTAGKHYAWAIENIKSGRLVRDWRKRRTLTWTSRGDAAMWCDARQRPVKVLVTVERAR